VIEEIALFFISQRKEVREGKVDFLFRFIKK